VFVNCSPPKMNDSSSKRDRFESMLKSSEAIEKYLARELR